jgi:hypothetical protein
MTTVAVLGVLVLVAVWLVGPSVWLMINRDNQRSSRVLAGIIVAVAIASVAFRLISRVGLHQSAALFIGIPTLLAIAAVFSPTPKSAVGVACKSVTIGLLVSLVFLGEGIICVAMSAPLFYLVAILIGKVVDEMNEDEPSGRSRLYSCIALMAFAPMTMEGVVPMTTIDRNVVVSETRVVAATPDQVATAPLRRRDSIASCRSISASASRDRRLRISGDTWVITMRGAKCV